MNLKNPRFVLVLLAGMLCVSLGFAGGQGEPTGPVEIDYWCPLGGGLGDIILEFEAQFQESNPNIKINHSYTGDYYETQQKMLAAVAAGDPPDITQVMDASLPMINYNQALADLTPYIQGKKGSNPVDYSDFISGFMFITEWKGGKYALPFNKSTPLMYFNRDIFSAAGINPPDPGFTWQELDSAAEKLTVRKGSDVEVYGFEMPVSVWFWEGLMWGNGGQYVNEAKTKSLVNAREGLEVTEWWVDMAKRNIMKQPPGRRYNAWDAGRVDFTNNKAAMIFDSTGAMGGFEGLVNFGAAFLPKGRKSYATPYGGTFISILEKNPDNQKAAAWQFISWLTDTAQTSVWSQKTGYMPVRKSAIVSPDMTEYYKKHRSYQVAVNQLEYAVGNPLLVAIFEAREIIDEQLIAAVLGEKSPKEAMDEASKKFDELLAKEPR